MSMIALIAPSKNIEEIALKAKKKHNLDIDIFTGLMENGVEIVGNLNKQGYKVFIARGGTALLINKVFPNNVVEIKMSLDDAIKALSEAREYGDKIEFIGFANHLQGFESLGNLFNLDIKQTVIEETNEAHNSVRKAKENGVNVVVGGAVQIQVAKEIGIPSVFLPTSEGAILSAYKEAKTLLNAILDQERKAKEVRTVLDYSDEGFIAIDSEKRITMVNKLASDIFGFKENEIVGRKIDETLPQISNLSEALIPKVKLSSDILSINSNSFLYNRIPMSENEKITGAMAVIKEVKKVQKDDEIIRSKLREKGLYAKYTFNDILGRSPNILKMKEIAKEFAKTESTILITSETGTGKEMFAQSIHNSSVRKDGPFVAINCASLAESILESELFGYVEGAFTGARRKGKSGVFEMAKGGTIFLDEIAEIPYEFQGRLLRVLQEHTIMRLGDDKMIPINVRVIAATNHNLIEDVKNGKFRSDLYYRLNVLEFHIPPLRERKEDIRLLSSHFLLKHGINPDLVLKSDVMDTLLSYDWHGNVRELENLMERIAAIGNSSNTQILVKEYMNSFGNLNKNKATRPVLEKQKITKESILETLEYTDGNKTKAAEVLGIHRSTLWRILNK